MNSLEQTYKSVSPSIGTLSLEEDFVALGLITKKEAEALVMMDNKMRDCVLGWLLREVNALALHDVLPPSSVTNKLVEKVSALRGVCAGHHDLFVRGMR